MPYAGPEKNSGFSLTFADVDKNYGVPTSPRLTLLVGTRRDSTKLVCDDDDNNDDDDDD